MISALSATPIINPRGSRLASVDDPALANLGRINPSKVLFTPTAEGSLPIVR
jgi:hypothetical protein